METGTVINVVATLCPPETEEKFNQWYNEIHIPLLLKCKALKSATRYKILNESENHPNYLAIYEFDSREAYKEYEASPELAAAIEEMQDTWKQKEYESKWRVQYELIQSWQK